MEDPKQNQNEEEYDVMSPRLSAYIREVEEGREPVYGDYKTPDEMWEDIFGDRWREVMKQC